MYRSSPRGWLRFTTSTASASFTRRLIEYLKRVSETEDELGDHEREQAQASTVTRLAEDEDHA
jgi:hypothetical protein